MADGPYVHGHGQKAVSFSTVFHNVKGEVSGLPAPPWEGGGNHAGGPGAHAFVFPVRLVIPAEEVKESMGEQLGDLGSHGHPFLPGLPACRGNADHHIAEKPTRALAEFSFSHSEGEHIGGFVFLAIEFVELLDLSIGR